MSVLQGNAKKFNGAAIDYVLIFDWITGAYIGVSTPNGSGVWTFDYRTDLLCGITYVADGCEPITHGPYLFTAENVLQGHLFICKARSSGYSEFDDVNATSNSFWERRFSSTKDIGVFDYAYSLSSIDVSVATPPTIINQFDLNWVLDFECWNSSSNRDTHKMTFELLDIDDNVLFAIKSETDGTRSSGLWYGRSLVSMNKAVKVGTQTSTQGLLSFDGGKVVYTNNQSGSYNNSFWYNVDIRSAVKLRVSGQALATFSSSGSKILIMPPSPTQ